MANIFLAFYNGITLDDNSAIPCYYESFINGLKKAGNTVFACYHKTFNGSNQPCPEDLLNQIKDFKPDLIILFNNFFYDISNDFDCPILIYEVDSYLYYGNKDKILENPNKYYYAVSQSSSIEVLTQNIPNLDKNRIILVPFFTEIQAEKIPVENNICFIGSKFTTGPYSTFTDFMNSNPTQNDINEFKVLIDYITKNPFSTKDELILKLNIKSELLSKKLDINWWLRRLIFQISDSKRLKILDSVSDLGLVVHGTSSWKKDLLYNPDLALSYNSKPIYSLTHNQNLYNSSKIGININHIQATTGFSWRVLDIMASNACLVSEYKPDFDLRFPKELPLQTFTNMYEAREICQKLLNNENLRLEIIAQCQKVVNEKYRFKHVLSSLEKFLGIKLQHTNSKPVNYKIIYINLVTETTKPINQQIKQHKYKVVFTKIKMLKYSFKTLFYTLGNIIYLSKLDKINKYAQKLLTETRTVVERERERITIPVFYFNLCVQLR